jgi:hypothetical protein
MLIIFLSIARCSISNLPFCLSVRDQVIAFINFSACSFPPHDVSSEPLLMTGQDVVILVFHLNESVMFLSLSRISVSHLLFEFPPDSKIWLWQDLTDVLIGIHIGIHIGRS